MVKFTINIPGSPVGITGTYKTIPQIRIVLSGAVETELHANKTMHIQMQGQICAYYHKKARQLCFMRQLAPDLEIDLENKNFVSKSGWTVVFES